MNNLSDKEKINIKVEKHLWPDEIKAKKKRFRSTLISLIVFSLVFMTFGLFLGMQINSSPAASNDKFSEIKRMMEEDWYFKNEIENLDEKVIDQAIKGLSNFSEYDIHTQYLSREEMQQFTSNLSGAYVGIGIQFYQSENGNLIIKRVFDNSPAQKGGLKAGDILLKVDDVSLENMSTQEVADLVLGKEDSELILTYLRDNKEAKVTLTRAQVFHSVYGEIINDIGYIELEQFGENTAQEVLHYLNKFNNQQNKLLIDLRDNGGGYLNTVVDIASYLIKKDEVVLITENNKGQQTKEMSNFENPFTFEKIVILINENTASASEVLVGALSEHLDNVIVVGSKSYGKGTVQMSKTFSDGSAFKYTIAEWLTPSGKKINKVGISPDVEVALHKILTDEYGVFDQSKTYQLDSVNSSVKTVQLALDFLGYQVDRFDGYFDAKTENALKSYQNSKGLKADGVLTYDLFNILITNTIREWTENTEKYDLQLQKALEILSE